MKKKLTFLFLFFASAFAYSQNLVTVTWVGTADSLTPPAGITVSDLTTPPVTISGTPTEVGVFTYIITTIGDDDTCEPHSITGTITVTPPPPPGCNSNVPGWGESLGTVFRGTQEWTITGNGITQIWSDAVTATNCQKTTFAGGLGGNFNADCRSNPSFPGDFFSWCAVVRFMDELCPSPWRVPTQQDFIDLDIAMGGTGNNRMDLNFVNANYITLWGGAFGGLSLSNGALTVQGNRGLYWSQAEGDATNGSNLDFRTFGELCPQCGDNKGNGFSLRCVR